MGKIQVKDIENMVPQSKSAQIWKLFITWFKIRDFGVFIARFEKSHPGDLMRFEKSDLFPARIEILLFLRPRLEIGTPQRGPHYLRATDAAEAKS